MKGLTCPPLSSQYALVKDVVSSLKRHRMHEQQFNHHPLLVLNNFGVEGMQVKLMASMFQHMFPSINVHKVRPASAYGGELGVCVMKVLFSDFLLEMFPK